ncbi:RNA polymerase sigma factor [Pedobacter frigoris]|uniref:RNA polymerase sigma-70 factor n=1 Tax=Pedobacter frigoris TaxID=2571272 RepID=A0A4U1CH35_9SPHI|nr:RNA polymerase sigma-70 factor [Pedobacter frigoris]TKC06075.1 RNA polymerase sigma-70 factor [Pedobacter frigoris]
MSLDERSYRGFSDTDLIKMIGSGDHTAFSELFRRYKEPLYFHAKRMLGDQDEARDIVQDVFTAIWSKREILVIPAAVDNYLYGSIRNKILDYIAHQKVIIKYADSFDRLLETGISSTDDLVSEKELARIIQTEISRLPEKMREVFELSRNGELSYKEIAEKLHLSEHTVKKQAQRAIKILRLKIKLTIFFFF